MFNVSYYSPDNLPEIVPGADLSRLIVDSFQESGITLESGDILVLAQKIVSKAEGRIVDLDTVRPGAEAIRLAGESQKDPRLVELILNESRSILRIRPGLIVPETKHGLISANAGIDASNTGGLNRVILLPEDPDASAEKIRSQISNLTNVQTGVLIIDSQGRPFRVGAVGVAIGCAGLAPLVEHIGKSDRDGRVLRSSAEAVADELASGASLLMGQAAEGRPLVLVRGLAHLLGFGKADALVRDPALDMFR